MQPRASGPRFCFWARLLQPGPAAGDGLAFGAGGRLVVTPPPGLFEDLPSDDDGPADSDGSEDEDPAGDDDAES